MKGSNPPLIVKIVIAAIGLILVAATLFAVIALATIVFVGRKMTKTIADMSSTSIEVQGSNLTITNSDDEPMSNVLVTVKAVPVHGGSSSSYTTRISAIGANRTIAIPLSQFKTAGGSSLNVNHSHPTFASLSANQDGGSTSESETL
jgi:hypothetical protein